MAVVSWEQVRVLMPGVWHEWGERTVPVLAIGSAGAAGLT